MLVEADGRPAVLARKQAQLNLCRPVRPSHGESTTSRRFAIGQVGHGGQGILLSDRESTASLLSGTTGVGVRKAGCTTFEASTQGTYVSQEHGEEMKAANRRLRGGAQKGTRNPSKQTSRSKHRVEGFEERDDWRDGTLSKLRAVIVSADPLIVEEVKWRKPSNPEGVPVWSRDGMVCIGNILKNSVRLTFPKGAKINDPRRIFNARLDSKTVRAIDVHEAEPVDEKALRGFVIAAVRLNRARAVEQ